MVLSELEGESPISCMPIPCRKINHFKASCSMRMKCSKVQSATMNVILYIQAKKKKKKQTLHTQQTLGYKTLCSTAGLGQ